MDGMNLSLVAALTPILTAACTLAGALTPAVAQAGTILVPIETRFDDIEIRTVP
jgi:hypothetical protein